MTSGADVGTPAVQPADVARATIGRRPFRVAAGHVMAYARAIGDPALAASLPAEGTAVPPTFVMTDLLVDPAHMRGAGAIGYLGVHPTRPGRVILLARQRVDFIRALRVGDQLLITDTRMPPSTKTDRCGASMDVHELIKTGVDECGQPVLRARTTLVETAPRSGNEPSPGPRPRAPSPAEAMPARGRGDLHVQAPITRTGIVQFSGASGDFSRLHTDEPYARAQGFPSVLAHGLMVMAASIRPLTDRIGIEAVSSYDARFLAPVYPGDTLTVRVEPEPTSAERSAPGSHRISTSNQLGVEVLSGTVTENRL
jgi:acyl dehydratase